MDGWVDGWTDGRMEHDWVLYMLEVCDVLTSSSSELWALKEQMASQLLLGALLL